MLIAEGLLLASVYTTVFASPLPIFTGAPSYVSACADTPTRDARAHPAKPRTRREQVLSYLMPSSTHPDGTFCSAPAYTGRSTNISCPPRRLVNPLGNVAYGSPSVLRWATARAT